MTEGVTREWQAQQLAKATAPVTEGWKDGALCVFVEGRPWNPQAGDMRNRWKKARTVKTWRERTASRLLPHARAYSVVHGRYVFPWEPRQPKRVAFTVYSRQAFDDDNLSAVCKPSRDALKDMRVIDDDAPKCGHLFLYRNVVAPRLADVHGIAIAIGLLT
jgi:hypothetical protein